MNAPTVLSRVSENGIFQKILSQKEKEVAALKGKAFSKRLRRPPVSFQKALKRKGPAFIFEIKRTSPGLGNIRPKANVSEYVKAYAPFADAISVLTDKRFFNGSVADLKKAGELTNLPLLAKDFFIHPVQIEEAYSAGADAILLMLSALNDQGYKTLSETAQNFNLEVLTEIHNAKEMKRAKALGAKIIGINNRDLKTLRVDLKTTERLAPKAPRGAVVISESGFSTRHEILKRPKRVDGFLIGSSVMGAQRPDLKIRELVFGEVKVCGFTNPEDAALAFSSGALFGGVNLVEGTPRFVDPGQGPEIMAGTPMKWVGVFRNTDPSYIAAVVDFLNLFAVQLHGFETPEFRKQLRRLLPKGTEIWQAVEGNKYSPNTHPLVCDRVLLDSRYKNVFGGTGHVFSWRRLGKINQKKSLGLAGGLRAANVQKAIQTGIPLLDVCSGLEHTEGVKNPDRVKGFFATIRAFEGKYYG